VEQCRGVLDLQYRLGSAPQGELIEAGGALYGSTRLFGSGNRGAVYRVNPGGSGYTNLHFFTGGADG
jgi:uncharacterized repeat protein (TIGR03803 family)